MSVSASGSEFYARELPSFSGRSHPISLHVPPRSLKLRKRGTPADALGIFYGRSLRTCASVGTQEVGEQFDGTFGKWTLEESDRREVLAYRAGLTVAAAGLLIDSGISLLPESSGLREAVRDAQNAVAIVAASGLGASYFLIHIYVTPLKRFLQALFAVGCGGGLYLMASQDVPVTEYVASHREAVWLVGPLFASITGLGIKEGLCYGTAAALGITLVTPVLCLGHLSGLMPELGTKALLVVLNLLALTFAAGKYSQPIKGDIGDKSIFEVQALPKEEQEKKWEALRRAREEEGQLLD